MLSFYYEGFGRLDNQKVELYDTKDLDLTTKDKRFECISKKCPESL